ncbi:MAG: hypothetical protein NT007_14945 [Candidatus Kapabacteria bacterium]|nr:hypothetical protein [Candidatus Kapabacteria bacterium]
MKKIIFLVLIIVFGGCHIKFFPPVQKRSINETTYKLSKTIIFDKCVKFMIERKVFPQVIDKQNGVVHYKGDFLQILKIYLDENGNDTTNSEVIDCGYFSFQQNIRHDLIITGEIIIYVYEIDNSSCKVNIQCKKEPNFTNYAYDQQCISTGLFESSLYDYLQK